MLSIQKASGSIIYFHGEHDFMGGLENITCGGHSAECFLVGEGWAVVPWVQVATDGTEEPDTDKKSRRCGH